MKYSYTIVLGLSLCGVLAFSHFSGQAGDGSGVVTGKGIAGIQWSSLWEKDSPEEAFHDPLVPEEPQNPENPEEEQKKEPIVPEESPETELPSEEKPVEEPPAEEPPAEVPEPVTREHYFDDALFIGDSRTVGLFEYADMGDADVFADAGMSIYKIHKASFPMGDRGKMSLEEVLTQKQYGKIYLMLGINELGYDQGQTVRKYGELASYIHSLQPDARMVLEANMHVSEAKSSRDSLYNNGNINAFNEQVRLLAEQEEWDYLDVNERFDDENGNLDSQYTADDAHLLGKYYEEWAEWIYQKENPDSE